MTHESAKNGHEMKRAVVGFASLLGSSVISALGFILIASNRWHLFDPSIAVFIILFVQWQTLGLTVAKLGVEQTVFALVSERNDISMNNGRFILRTALPLSALFSLVVLFVFSPWSAAVAFLTVILDTSSLIIMAELNARKFFRVTTISNLLNYPLFFVLLFLLNLRITMNIATVLAIFLVTSSARWVWLYYNRILPHGMEKIDISCTIEMGVQQALNYLLFRFDQVLLAVMGLKTHFSETVALYVFLAKFPELAAGVMVIAGTVAFPSLYIHYPIDSGEIWKTIQKYSLVIAAYTLVLPLAAAAYMIVWKGNGVPWLVVLPFVIHSLLILPTNNLTYSMLRQGYLGGLISKLAISAVSALILILALGAYRDITILAWLVPAQLFTFILLGLLFGWGRQKALYA
jgi:hypothetical protein